MVENTVFVGSKPPMAYVMAIITSLGNSDEVVVRARGRAISTAVDAVEITRNRFMSDLEYDIEIGTEEMPQEVGGTRNVSTMAITLRKSRAAANRAVGS